MYSLYINTNLYLQTIFLFNCLIFYNWEILCLQTSTRLASKFAKHFYCICNVRLSTISSITQTINDASIILFVRLNLFNHVLVLFHAKFARNLAIRYLVFRRELCKSSVWESMKKAQEVCTQKEPHDWISQLVSRLNGTRVKHVGGAKGSHQLLNYRTKLPVWPGS